ncbi:Sulfite exporter TauE/SafE [Bordetella ansorpii]|uniref:Probable membrane transporter protein n=1 Tax=Bordetella ansorpii TaxID=288768 RepID=A0A157SNH8_9BORD|nr:sulfite exporter TauE/SafE family protein [Bordetella ansorpii]SAI71446.1 Sulfite exporter TauE/SafE [Bordetella ansorpii]
MPLLAHLATTDLLIIWLGVAIAYLVFGIAGFGTALVASPLLAQFMPVAQIVPLLALLDFCAAATHLIRDGRQADRAELTRLAPLMLAGGCIGTGILLHTRPDVLLLLLGVFVIAYALYSLAGGYQPESRCSPRLAVPFGLAGGVFGALFGSGGFLYAIYLQGRLDDKQRMRVTQSSLIGLSTLIRVVLFLIAGVYADANLLILAALLAPSMLIGVWAGRRITLRLSREQFVRLVNGVVLVSGVFVLVRYFA